ncbi:MAG: hypothetical protein ATN31_10170 [Candidatus Epulonipiscioides saccharophilum]|nr:MAG: hypothetical protein ATN31_10170 [Epulopiscium sp. AS2M-Bin001]
MKKYLIQILILFLILPIVIYGEYMKDNEIYESLKPFLQELQGVKELYIGSSITINNNIQPLENDTVTIKEIEMLEQNNGDLVSILMDGKVSNVMVRNDGKKLILEIENSIREIPVSIMPFENDTISEIESFDKDGVTIIEFKLKKNTHIETMLTNDRSEIIIQFYGKPIEIIVAGTDDLGDYLVLNNLKSTEVNFNLDHNAKKLKIKIPHNYLKEQQEWLNFNGEYIDKIKINNAIGGLEIDIDLSEVNFNYVFEEKQQALFIRFQKIPEDIGEAFFGEIILGDAFMGQADLIFDSKLENIEKTKQINLIKKPLMIDKASNSLLLAQYNTEKLQIIDNYREREIILDLGANYSSIYKTAKLKINSNNIREIEIVNADTTKLIIKSDHICTYNRSEIDNGLKIEVVRPKEKFNKILMLDIGHGGKDPGSIGNGLIEKELNMMQTLAIKDFIEKNSDIKVYMTREDDQTLTLTYRTDLANEIGVDLFLSVHNNSHTKDTPTGSEVFYFPKEFDTSSKILAENMIEKIVAYTGMFNRGAKPSEKLVVLRTSQMPSLLVEGGFLSNEEDAKRLMQDEFTINYAKAIAETIIDFLN